MPKIKFFSPQRHPAKERGMQRTHKGAKKKYKQMIINTLRLSPVTGGSKISFFEFLELPYSKTAMKKYLIVVEETPTGFSAYSPDLDGCVATGATREDVEKNIHDAIEFHLDGMKEEGFNRKNSSTLASGSKTFHCHSCESRNPEKWMPAFAGMTTRYLDACVGVLHYSRTS